MSVDPSHEAPHASSDPAYCETWAYLVADVERKTTLLVDASWLPERGVGNHLVTLQQAGHAPQSLRVEERRQLVERHACIELPENWQEMPEKLAPTSRAEAERAGVGLAAGDRLEGLGASAGVHEGIARVVLDPSDPALGFDAGDILVAPATDPSWAPLLLVAGAVVIKPGSNISHAAVVAREMGIPAVVAARDASFRLRSDQRLRVDGKVGIVEVVASRD